jgi:acyl carrier protein
MSMLSSEDVVRDILGRLSVVPDIRAPVTADSRIAEDLNMDSLAIMNFIMTLEDRYDVALPIDKLAKIKTVRELADLIVHLCDERPAS